RPEYNANEWQNNLIGLSKSNFTQKMPGFSLGGPIKKNNTFFFVNSQWLRADRTIQVTPTVYTQQARPGILRHVIGCTNQPVGIAGASVDANGNPLPGVAIGSYNIAANDPQRRGVDPTIQAFIGQTPLPNNFNGVGDGLNTAGYTFAGPEQEKQ